MFKVLALQTLYALLNDETKYQIKHEYDSCGFVGLKLSDRVPDAKTSPQPRGPEAAASAVVAFVVVPTMGPLLCRCE
jgi:hypothetical protein